MLNEIVAKVRLHNYRYPKDKAHTSGDYAIILFSVVELVDGVIPKDAVSPYGGSIIVTGCMPRIEHGIEYLLQARLVNDAKWGRQWECIAIRMNYDLSNEEDQKKFFSYFLTERQIDLLFNEIDNPMEALKNHDVETLTKIKGIGPVTASRMCIKYSENINNGRAYIELKNLGITKAAIDKLIKQFGSADVVVDLINTNPYNLIRLVRGYGWEKADKIALAQGFTTDSPERIIAYAQYRLEKNADDGNSCMSIDELLDSLAVICSPATKEDASRIIKQEMIGNAEFEELYLKVLAEEEGLNFPLFFYSNENRKVSLFYYRLLERKILHEIKRIMEAPSELQYDRKECELIIKQVEEEQGYKFTHEQMKAIWATLDNNITILTGSAGSGKSSTVKPIVKIFEHYSQDVCQCALSGRAASLLTTYTELEGRTIHRLLGYNPEKEGFTYNKDNPLKTGAVILDETSMVGEELFLDLISAIPSGSKLIMLGDVQQLPPINVGNILSDCMSSGYIPVNMLTIIHRQALQSGIISQAHSITQGKPLMRNDFTGEDLRGELKDFHIIAYSDAMLVHGQVVKEFQRLLSKGIPADDIQIITPMRSKGINSCRMFNAEIQRIVNPEDKKNVALEMNDNGAKFTVVYKPGDKIMVTKNNYHAMTVYGKEVAIFNGNMGHITDIDDDAMIISLAEQGDVIIRKEEFRCITHAWAATCHRLQGSQAPYTIICVDKGAYVLLMREWMYTAVTRAQKYCTLVGQPKAINAAIRNSNIKIKQTWLREELYKAYREKVKI